MKIPITILSVLMLCASVARAQTTETSGSSFAVLAGVNFQNLNGTDYDGTKLENDMITGFHAGVNMQIPVAPEFYFQPGLLFSTKGAQNTEEGFTFKYSIAYVELPLNFVYKGALGSGHVLVGFGPYLAYGISGKVSTESTEASTETDIVFQSVVETTDPFTVPYLKAMDVGGNIFAGYEMASGIFLQLNTQFGMIKINPEDKRIEDDKSSLKNTGFGLSVGYRF